jgi:hypothetical protein
MVAFTKVLEVSDENDLLSRNAVLLSRCKERCSSWSSPIKFYASSSVSSLPALAVSELHYSLFYHI